MQQRVEDNSKEEEEEEEELETDHLEEWRPDIPQTRNRAEPLPIPNLPVSPMGPHGTGIRGQVYRACCSAHHDACVCS